MKKTLTSILAAGLIGLAGCEDDPKPNDGQGVDNFKLNISNGYIWHTGEEREAQAEVKPNVNYNVKISGQNDGPSDQISIWVDNVKIGTYNTLGISRGGNGWWGYASDSPSFPFVPTKSPITIKVHVDSADKYGTAPDTIYVDIISKQ